MALQRPVTSQLEILFQAVDVDGDGRISEADLQSFMRERAACDVDDEQVKALLGELVATCTSTQKSTASSHCVDFSGFVAFFTKQLSKPLPDMLEDVFRLIDTNHDDRLSPAELVAFAERVKLKLGIDTAAHLLSSATTSGSSKESPELREKGVDFQQFCVLVQRALPSFDRVKQ